MGTWVCFRGFGASPEVCRLLQEAHSHHKRKGFFPVFDRVECEGCGRRVRRTQHRLADYFKSTWPAHVCPGCKEHAPHSHYVHLAEGRSSRSTCTGCGEKQADSSFRPAHGSKPPWCGGGEPRSLPKPEPSQRAAAGGGRRAGGAAKTGKSGRKVLRWQDQLSATHPRGWKAYLETKYSSATVQRRLSVPTYDAPLAASNRLVWATGYVPWAERQGFELEGHPKMARLREHFPGWRSLSGHSPEELLTNAWAAQTDPDGVGNKCVGDYCVYSDLQKGVSITHHFLEKAAPQHGGHSGPNEPWNLQGLCPVCHAKEHQLRALQKKMKQRTLSQKAQ